MKSGSGRHGWWECTQRTRPGPGRLKEEAPMDLYLEFRKMIRPLIIPDNDGRSTTQEKQTQQGQPADERGVRRDEKDEVIRSIATCETW